MNRKGTDRVGTVRLVSPTTYMNKRRSEKCLTKQEYKYCVVKLRLPKLARAMVTDTCSNCNSRKCVATWTSQLIYTNKKGT